MILNNDTVMYFSYIYDSSLSKSDARVRIDAKKREMTG